MNELESSIHWYTKDEIERIFAAPEAAEQEDEDLEVADGR